ncbi:hypothetical protein [Streptomyces sp. NBC_00996]|uniref:hypothetical protein n=1 Tax=Streptomyces sp. NBC_00996 TaxID=2903710 RepID=UPI003868B9C6|nr:hypothetical protein OG390_22655 [Streptomyces sp. NBC_00996]
MSDAAKNEPIVEPDNTHVTGGEDGEEITPLNTHVTSSPIKPLNTVTGDDGTATPDNTHVTSEPS